MPAPPLPDLDDCLDVIEAWMREHAPEVLDAHQPASPEDLARLEALGPGTRDLIALYRRFGGTTDWQGFWDGLELLPAASALGVAEMMRGIDSEGSFYRWMPNEWWHPAWLPFLDNHSYDLVCIDLEGIDGPPGQLVTWAKDSASRPIIAPSLSAWLGMLVLASREGLVEWNREGGMQGVVGKELELSRFHEEALPGYPIEREARLRRDVEGVEPPPSPPGESGARDDIELEVVKQWWAPASASVHCLAYVPWLDALAIGQYDWNEKAPGGMSIVDVEASKKNTQCKSEVSEVVLGHDEGSVLELCRAGERIVLRRLRGSANEVLVYDAKGLRLLQGELPTRMEAVVGIGTERVAVGSDPVMLHDFTGSPRELNIHGEDLVVAVSPDDSMLAVAAKDAPLRWYDVSSGKLLGQTDQPVRADMLAFGVAGDLWVAGNPNSMRFDLATGASLPHEQCHHPFVLAIHRVSERIAFAGYNAGVFILDARSGERLAYDYSHEGRVYGLDWDDTGTRLWSGDEAGLLVERRIAKRA